jgi:hypothetical protein
MRHFCFTSKQADRSPHHMSGSGGALASCRTGKPNAPVHQLSREDRGLRLPDDEKRARGLSRRFCALPLHSY